MPESNQRISENVDIYQYPEIISPIDNNSELSLGDLHGNAITLLFTLLKHEIIELSEEKYLNLVEIYKKKVDDLTREDIALFNSILNSAQIKNHVKIRLIGDELADRGQNDYFTLRILEQLKKNNVELSILASNHSMEFLFANENFKDNGNHYWMPSFVGPVAKFGLSLSNMSKLITKGVIQQEEIQRITDDLYIPAAKLIDYTLEPNENKIIIYSHAGIGIEIIKALAEKLNVVYNDATADELARTIDRINREFIKNIKGNTINEIVNTDTLYSGLTLQQIDKEKSPIEFLLWNRDYHDLERPAKHNNYEMHFVHGHDSQELNSENITVLNSDLGKDLKLNKGTYESLLSTNVRRLNQNNNLSSTPLRGLGEEISQNPPAAKSSHSFFTRPTKEVGAGTAINLTAVAAAVGVMGLMAANGPGSAILTATAVTVAGASISTGGLALAIGLAVLGAIGTGLIIKGLYDHHQNNKQNTKGKRSQSEPNIYVCPDDLTLGFK